MSIPVSKLQQTITLRYLIALSLIALLATVAYFTLKTAIESTKSTGYIVNISGKQRMLSQHIALDIYRIENAYKEKDQNVVLFKQILNEHANEMLHANKSLSTGTFPNENVITLSDKIKQMYFGEMKLASRVEMYANTALKILNTTKEEEIKAIIKYIDTHSENLLKDLNKAVNQYQLEGEKKLQRMQNLETLVWILTIFTLLLEVIFIFQPLVRKIVLLSLSNQKNLNELEMTVELRTAHLEKANQQLKHMASHDHLTGLRNRLKLENSIERAISLNKSNALEYAVLMLDIDWFKKVNDTYGHDVGDVVLVEIAHIIQNALREDDKVFRAGGEEFVVLLENISLKDTQKLAEKIKSLIENHIFTINEHQFSKTVSIGLYHSTLIKLFTTRDVLKIIDVALYESKRQGRNRITVTKENMIIPEEKKATSKISLIFNDASFAKLVDYRDEEFIIDLELEKMLSAEKNFLSLVHHHDLYLLDNIPESATLQNPYSTTLRVFDANQQVHICRVTIYLNQDNSLSLCLKDAKELAQKVSDTTLIQNLQAMLENTNDYIYFKDINHVFTAGSKTLVSLTSVNSKEELIGKVDYDVFPKDLSDEYFKLEREVLDHKLNVAQDIQPTLDKDGNAAWVDNRKYPIYDSQGSIIGLFGIARVISQFEYENLPLEK